MLQALPRSAFFGAGDALLDEVHAIDAVGHVGIQRVGAVVHELRAEALAKALAGAPYLAARAVYGAGSFTEGRLHEYGTTLEQLAEVAVSARYNAQFNPDAYYREPLTIAEVLDEWKPRAREHSTAGREGAQRWPLEGVQVAAEGVGRNGLFIQTKFTPIDGHDHRVPYDPELDLADQVRRPRDRRMGDVLRVH